ncbi:DUF1294 domain-containing protein [Sorangium sp. So ce131]|uniref:DUF1294 domain-containing protein n=1 Tax=Sorangium sp. So ce131 TaxID=3133282 RepID=UPI003F61B6BA
MLALPAFFLVYLAVAFLWKPPPWIAGAYAGASLVAFIVYAVDKSAAERGERRTPERTLHLLALAGGWPGALIAQQLFRHKSKKAAFRLVFWCTVLLNVGGFVALCSPYGRRLLAAV